MQNGFPLRKQAHDLAMITAVRCSLVLEGVLHYIVELMTDCVVVTAAPVRMHCLQACSVALQGTVIAWELMKVAT